jgi:hypothetical protein
MKIRSFIQTLTESRKSEAGDKGRAGSALNDHRNGGDEPAEPNLGRRA